MKSARREVRQTSGMLDSDRLVDLVSFVDDAVPIRKLRFTGGEPLLKPGLFGLIKEFGRALPRAELCLTTNGLLLDKMAHGLKEAGIASLNISLDTTDPEMFRELTGVSGLSRVLAGIGAAQRAGFENLKLNTVLMRTRNRSRLVDLVRTAARFGCEIRFVELMPFGEGARLFEKDYLSSEEALDIITSAFPCRGSEEPSATAKRYRLAVLDKNVIIGFIPSVSHPFCSGCDRIRLDSAGRIFSCLRSECGIDLETGLREGRYEDMKEKILRAATRRKKQSTPWPARSMALLGG